MSDPFFAPTAKQAAYGTNLRELRLALGLKARHVADCLGALRQNVEKWEQGYPVPEKFRARLHQLLGVIDYVPAAQNSPAGRRYWEATHQHRKGGLYRVLHRDNVFIEADMVPAVIYDDDDGRIWVRPASEFDDGRFTVIATASP